MVLPSSQPSDPMSTESPQSGVHRLPGTRHCQPGSTAVQSAEQPSPLKVLPSSHVSSALRMPLPQLAGTEAQGPLAAMHCPPEQQPAAQKLPAQQTSPRPPQRAHTLLGAVPAQIVPGWQDGVEPLAAQHTSPA
jgi:hypothetical protein